VKDIVIKSFNGIGDLLFVTPTLRRLKEDTPHRVIVNTNRPGLLQNSPFVDEVGTQNEGVFLGYPAPDCEGLPYQHHILSDWEIVCAAYEVQTSRPSLYPELFITDLPEKRDVIGVQTMHKRYYHGKRIWTHFDRLAECEGFEAIPLIGSDVDPMIELVKKIAEYKCVVCAEGGISHIAAALRMPAVVLFGGFSDPEWTGYPSHRNLVSYIRCRHCFDMNPCELGLKCWDSHEFSLNYVKEIIYDYEESDYCLRS
jgi:hypothetical protein